MIIIERVNEVILLNNNDIFDCTFNNETGIVKVRTTETQWEYTDVVTFSLVSEDGTHTTEWEVIHKTEP